MCKPPRLQGHALRSSTHIFGVSQGKTYVYTSLGFTSEPYHQRSQNVAGGFARFLGPWRIRGTCGLINFRVRHTLAYPRRHTHREVYTYNYPPLSVQESTPKQAAPTPCSPNSLPCSKLDAELGVHLDRQAGSLCVSNMSNSFRPHAMQCWVPIPATASCLRVSFSRSSFHGP